MAAQDSGLARGAGRGPGRGGPHRCVLEETSSELETRRAFQGEQLVRPQEVAGAPEPCPLSPPTSLPPVPHAVFLVLG